MDLNNMKKGGLGDLKTFEVDFDENGVWQRIESKKKRRPIFWFWMVGVMLMIMTIGGFWFFSNGSSIKNNNQPIKEHLVVENQLVNKEIAKEILSNKLNSIKREKALIENNETEVFNSLELEVSNNNSKRNAFTIQKNEVLETTVPSEYPIFEESNFATNTKEDYKRKQKQFVDSIESLPLSAIEIATPTNFDFEMKNLDKLPISIKKSNQFSLSLFSGIGYQVKSLNSKNDLNDQDYINLRNKNETVLESIIVGVDIDKKLTNRWYLGTGIEMVMHSEKLRISESQIGHIDDLKPEDIPDNLIGQRGFLVREDISEFYNQYRLLNAPVKLGYLIRLKKLRLIPEAGLVFNISQKSKGDIQNREGLINDLAPLYKTNIGLSYRGGCKFLAPLKNGFVVYTKPSFEFNPNNIASEDNPLIQKRSFIRMDFGLSRSF